MSQLIWSIIKGGGIVGERTSLSASFPCRLRHEHACNEHSTKGDTMTLKQKILLLGPSPCC